MDLYKNLSEQRAKIEEEIKHLTEILQSNKIGMEEPLVDSEGFPRADIDVVAVRTARVRIIELRNDFKRLNEQLGDALNVIYAKKDAPESSSANYVPNYSSSGLKVIAVIDAVMPDSPADKCGLKRNDYVISFGSVCFSALGNLPGILQKIANEVKDNEDKEIEVLVYRGELRGPELTPDVLTSLKLVPTKWEGRGLLGCHIVEHVQK